MLSSPTYNNVILLLKTVLITEEIGKIGKKKTLNSSRVNMWWPLVCLGSGCVYTETDSTLSNTAGKSIWLRGTGSTGSANAAQQQKRLRTRRPIRCTRSGTSVSPEAPSHKAQLPIRRCEISCRKTRLQTHSNPSGSGTGERSCGSESICSEAAGATELCFYRCLTCTGAHTHTPPEIYLQGELS